MRVSVTEKQLSDQFPGSWQGRVGHRGFSSLDASPVSELACQLGRPDFVTIESRRGIEWPSEVLGALRVPATVRVLALLKERVSRSEGYLAEASGLSIPVARRAIRALEESGLVERLANGGLIVNGHLRGLDAELWAFELKVRDWRRALYQASRYKTFAHRSSVVVAERFSGPAAKSLDRFRRLRVGLYALSTETGELRALVLPRKREPLSRFHYLYALGAIMRRLDSNGTGP